MVTKITDSICLLSGVTIGDLAAELRNRTCRLLNLLNWAHLHLILNHFPVLGTLLLTGLMLLSLWKKERQILVLTFQVTILIGIMTPPTYFTGEPSEEFIEHLPGVSEAIINRHENAALYGLIVSEVVAVFGILGLVLVGKNIGQAFKLLKPLLVLSVGNFVLMAWIANLGGQIRHSEIREPSSEKVAMPQHSENATGDGH